MLMAIEHPRGNVNTDRVLHKERASSKRVEIRRANIERCGN
jgi:hypothetical protein